MVGSPGHAAAAFLLALWAGRTRPGSHLPAGLVHRIATDPRDLRGSLRRVTKR